MISVKIPMRLLSEANNTDHWTQKHKRKKKIKLLLLSYLPDLREVQLPCKVTLIRISPRSLDFDNLVISFKYIRDFLADKLNPGLAPGRADDHKDLIWVYDQMKGSPKEYAIQITIQELDREYIEG